MRWLSLTREIPIRKRIWCFHPGRMNKSLKLGYSQQWPPKKTIHVTLLKNYFDKSQLQSLFFSSIFLPCHNSECQPAEIFPQASLFCPHVSREEDRPTETAWPVQPGARPAGETYDTSYRVNDFLKKEGSLGSLPLHSPFNQTPHLASPVAQTHSAELWVQTIPSPHPNHKQHCVSATPRTLPFYLSGISPLKHWPMSPDPPTTPFVQPNELADMGGFDSF